MNSVAIMAMNLNLAAAETTAGGPPAFLQMVPFLLIFVMFYFLIMRPQSQKAKEHRKMVEAIKSGDKVVVAGGIHGVVSNTKEGIAVIRIAEGVKIEVDKSSISSVVKGSESESK